MAKLMASLLHKAAFAVDSHLTHSSSIKMLVGSPPKQGNAERYPLLVLGPAFNMCNLDGYEVEILMMLWPSYIGT